MHNMKTISIIIEGTESLYPKCKDAIIIPDEKGSDSKRRAVLKDLYLMDYLAENTDILYHDADCRIYKKIYKFLEGKNIACGKTINVFDSFLIYSNNTKFWKKLNAEYIKFNYEMHGPIYGFLSKLLRRKDLIQIPKNMYKHSMKTYKTLTGNKI